MTTFEIIILVIYYLFAWSYVGNDYIAERQCGAFRAMIIAAAIGIVMFPLIFARDIWIKLNS